MDSWRFSHHRRLIALSTLLVAVLVAAVVITVHTMRQRQELSANYSAALDLAANSSTLRVAASELFTWQIAGTLGMLEGRPDATDAADPARQQYGDAIRGIDSVLGQLATGPLDTAERAQLDQARAALAELRRLDAAIRTDYASGDETRMRDAARTATTTGIDQYQVVSDSLSQLALRLDERAGRLGDENEQVGMQVQLLVVSLAGIMIVALIGLLTWAWQDGRRNRQVISQLSDEAALDPLTAVANRRRWDARLADALRRGRADGTPFTVVLIDLDHFKRFNDTYGHPAGDRQLQAMARLCEDVVRRGDLVARLGGEEFGLLLTASVALDAARVVERMRPLVPGGETFSAGIAEWDGSESATELVARADEALYAAKTAGRDRLQLASR